MSDLHGFKPGRESDSDEKAAGEKHIRPKNTKASVNLPSGEWVDVPKGMVAAPGTYVDDHGVLRAQSDDSCVTWHQIRRDDNGNKIHCQRRGIKPEEIVYDPATGAPWCPECWPIHNEIESLNDQTDDSKSKVSRFLDGK